MDKANDNYERPGWDEYFMEITDVVAKRSNCVSRKVGAVITVDNQIVSTGYNGAPKGLHHCVDAGGCLRRLNNIQSGTRQEVCRAVHAEQNAIISAAVKGVSIKGGTLYINTYPCSICTRMIINAEIKRIVYNSDYSDELSKEMLEESKIKVIKFKR
jgi:dCMP deaminase